MQNEAIFINILHGKINFNLHPQREIVKIG